MKLLYWFILYQILAVPIFSQTKSSHKDTGVEIFLTGGIQKSDLDNLGIRMNEFNKPAPGDFAGNGGAGLAFRYKKYSIGTEISLPFRNSLEKYDLSGTYIGVFLSSNLLELKPLVISPQLGLGFQKIVVTNRRGGSAFFNDFNYYVFTFNNDASFYNKNTMLDLAISLKLISKTTNSPIPIFRMGYRYGLTESEWKVKYATTTDGPKDRANTVYCQLMFGLGN